MKPEPLTIDKFEGNKPMFVELEDVLSAVAWLKEEFKKQNRITTWETIDKAFPIWKKGVEIEERIEEAVKELVSDLDIEITEDNEKAVLKFTKTVIEDTIDNMVKIIQQKR